MTCQLLRGKSVLTVFVTGAAASLAITQDHTGCDPPLDFGQLTTSNDISRTHYLLAFRLGVRLQLIHGQSSACISSNGQMHIPQFVLVTPLSNNGRLLRSSRNSKKAVLYCTLPCIMKTATRQKMLGMTGDERRYTGRGRKH